ncbi:hypothetical protein Tco_1276666 [Tanacetum coccineum]
MCKVYYVRTTERLIELCNEFGLRDLPEDGILTRTINIHINYPKKIAAEEKEADDNDQICYFDGKLDGSEEGIDKALKELHSNLAFHHNFARENVLLKFAPSGDVAIKLCGLGSSKSYTKKQCEIN